MSLQQPDELVLCDGSDSIDLLDHTAGYGMLKGGQFDPGTPTVSQQKRPSGERRFEERPVAYQYGNRTAGGKFLASGNSTQQVEDRVARVNRLLERATRAATRPFAPLSQFGYLRFRFNESSRVHWLRIMRAMPQLPGSFVGYSMRPGGSVNGRRFIADLAFSCECAPAFYDTLRPTLALRGAPGTPSTEIRSGVPVTATRHYTLPDCLTLDLFGGLMTWWWDVRFGLDATAERVLLDHETGVFRLSVTTDNRLLLTLLGPGGIIGPASYTTWIPLNSGNFGPGRHMLGVQWGDCAGLDADGNPATGLRIWLDGRPSTTGDAGLNVELLIGGNALQGIGGRVAVGNTWMSPSTTAAAIGAVDDLRWFRRVDSIFVDSVPWLFSRGIEPNSVTTVSADGHECGNGDLGGYPPGLDLTPSGDLPPEYLLTVGTRQPRASHAAMGIGKVALASRLDADITAPNTSDVYASPLAINYPRFAGHGDTAELSDDPYASGGSYIRSTGAAAVGSLRESLTGQLQARLYTGTFRVRAVVRRATSAAHSVQLILTQGPVNYQSASSVVSLAAGPVGQWTAVDFGVFSIPIWAAPQGADAPVAIHLWDDGTASSAVDWCCLKFLSFEALSPVWMWSSTTQATVTTAVQQAISSAPSNPGPSAPQVDAITATTDQPTNPTPDAPTVTTDEATNPVPDAPTVTPAAGGSAATTTYSTVRRVTVAGTQYDSAQSSSVSSATTHNNVTFNSSFVPPPAITSWSWLLLRQDAGVWKLLGIISSGTTTVLDDATATPTTYTPLGALPPPSSPKMYSTVRRVTMGGVQYDSALSPSALGGSTNNHVTFNGTFVLPSSFTSWSWLLLRSDASVWQLLDVVPSSTAMVTDSGGFSPTPYAPLAGLPPPGAPTGATTGYEYAVVRRVAWSGIQYDSPMSPTVVVTNQSVLDANHYNRVRYTDTLTPSGVASFNWLVLRRLVGVTAWTLLTEVTSPSIEIRDDGGYDATAVTPYVPLDPPLTGATNAATDNPIGQTPDLREDDRIVFDGPAVYRWTGALNGGWIAFSGHAQGAPFGLLPGVLNRLAVDLSRDDGDWHADDRAMLGLELRRRTLNLRGTG